MITKTLGIENLTAKPSSYGNIIKVNKSALLYWEKLTEAKEK